MRLSDYSVLTFDCYGTLIDWETGIAQTLGPWLERAGAAHSREQILAAFAEAEAPQQAATPGLLYPDLLARVHGALATRFGLAPDPQAARAFGASIKDWPAFANSAAALADLKQHYRLVILSNVDRASFAHSQQKLKVAFDAVYTAQDVGSYKPDPRNFEYHAGAPRRAGHRPRADPAHRKSLYHDHIPAKRFGLATCWIHRRAGQQGHGATRPPESRRPARLPVSDPGRDGGGAPRRGRLRAPSRWAASARTSSPRRCAASERNSTLTGSSSLRTAANAGTSPARAASCKRSRMIAQFSNIARTRACARRAEVGRQRIRIVDTAVSQFHFQKFNGFPDGREAGAAIAGLARSVPLEGLGPVLDELLEPKGVLVGVDDLPAKAMRRIQRREDPRDALVANLLLGACGRLHERDREGGAVVAGQIDPGDDGRVMPLVRRRAQHGMGRCQLASS